MTYRWIAAFWVLAACGQDGSSDEDMENASVSPSLADGLFGDEARTLPHEADLLSPGSRGPEVEHVYRYLHAYGYLPNPELSERFPGFVPLTSRSPAAPDAYDDALAEAVSVFQTNTHLEATGTVDAPTLARMTPRDCPYPDGYAPAPLEAPTTEGAQDKFALLGGSNARATWSVEDPLPAGTTRATVEAATQEMFNEWQTVHKNSFAKVAPGNGQIKIRFVMLDGPSHDGDGDDQCTPSGGCPGRC